MSRRKIDMRNNRNNPRHRDSEFEEEIFTSPVQVTESDEQVDINEGAENVTIESEVVEVIEEPSNDEIVEVIPEVIAGEVTVYEPELVDPQIDEVLSEILDAHVSMEPKFR